MHPALRGVVAKKPDLVVTAYEWMIGPEGAVGTREMFDDVEIPTWLMATECVGKDNSQSMDGTRTVLFNTDLLYQSISTLAEIFDVSDRGEEVIANLKARETAAIQKAKDLHLPEGVSGVFWYSSADLEIDPYVAGKNGVPGWMMATAWHRQCHCVRRRVANCRLGNHRQVEPHLHCNGRNEPPPFPCR